MKDSLSNSRGAVPSILPARAKSRSRLILPMTSAVICFCLALLICGCGFTSGSAAGPHNVRVSVSPSSASVSLGQTIQFTATVTGGTSSTVRWSVNNIAGGNSALGAISTAGLYTAPPTMPSASSVTVTATTPSVPQASGSATVQLQSGIVVSIAPNSASVVPSGIVNFNANVTGAGTSSSAVGWSVNGIAGGNAALGTLSSSGPDAATYTAPAIAPVPATVSVTATSVADWSKAASASITISCSAANSISPPSANVAIGATQIYAASLCVAPGTTSTWDVNGIVGGNSTVGTIVPNGPSTATYTAPLTLPPQNPVTIHAVAGAQSASSTVTVVNGAPVSVNVSPATAAVSAGQSASFTATVTGTPSVGVTWTVNGISNGNSMVGQVCAAGSNPCAAPSGTETAIDYLAPQTVPQPSIVTLMAASQTNPAITGSARVTIAAAPQPGVSLAPFYAFLGPSQQFQFFANVTGVTNTAVTWTVASAVPGQGCSGTSCGSIDAAGNYVAPATAPSPNAISVTATSIANPSLAASATVAVTSGPTIDTILPSSVIAGAQQNFQLAVKGLNFVPTTGSGSSQLLINNSLRSTSCPTPNLCTITLHSSDVAAAGALSVEIQNPGTPPPLSNPVSLVIVPPPQPPNAISLTSATPFATDDDMVVTEPTTAGATTSPVSVDFAGMVSPDGSTCTIQAATLTVTRPISGTITVSICVQGTFLDPTFTYAFSAPQTGGDIGITTASMTNLFPNLIELTLTISNQTTPGLRTLFVTTPNGDVATATGILEVK